VAGTFAAKVPATFAVKVPATFLPELLAKAEFAETTPQGSRKGDWEELDCSDSGHGEPWGGRI